MSDIINTKPANWKKIFIISVVIFIIIAITAFATIFKVISDTKGKLQSKRPEVSKFFDNKIKKIADKKKLDPAKIEKVKELKILADGKNCSLWGFYLCTGTGLYALEDEHISKLELEGIAQVQKIVKAKNGNVTFKDFRQFITDNPNFFKLFQQFEEEAATKKK